MSNLAKNLTDEVGYTRLHFGHIQERLPAIHVALANQFLGANPDQMTFDGFNPDVDEESLDFSGAKILSSIQSQGAYILDFTAQKIAQGLVKGLSEIDADDPAVLTTAYQIAAHIGMAEFRDVAARVAERSGISMQGDIEHEITISASHAGVITVRRTSQCGNALIHDDPIGPLIVDWVLACELKQDKPGTYILGCDVMELGLLTNVESESDDLVNALDKLELRPSFFVQFLEAFSSVIDSVMELLGVRYKNIKLDAVTEYVEYDAEDSSDFSAGLYQGWRATRSTLDAKLIINRIGEHTASVMSLTLFTMLSDTQMEWRYGPTRAYTENKFKFQYSMSDIPLALKLEEEDRFALETLQAAETVEVVKFVSEQFADYLENRLKDGMRSRFFMGAEYLLSTLQGKYPIAREKIVSFDSLMAVLRSHENHVLLLSFLWPVVSKYNSENILISDIDRLYSETVYPTHDYKETKGESNLIEINRFGNSKKIDSDLFSSEVFHPFSRSVDYIIKSENSEN